MEIKDWIQVGLDVVGIIAAAIVGYLAYRIGKKQNEINHRSLGLSDYADVFLMPCQVAVRQDDGKEQFSHYKLLIKNASSYPIYLNGYILNGVKFEVGATIIPVNSEN